jgi:molybdopterin/thiamine biosynthesis adenylyltransferase
VELRIPSSEGRMLWDSVVAPGEERVAFASIGYAGLADRHVLLISSLLVVPESEYTRDRNGTSWSARINVHAIERATRAKLGLLIIHSHGAKSNPTLSVVDRQNGELLCSAFRTAIPDRPHGTVVIGKNGSVSGLVWLPGQKRPLEVNQSRWVSDPVRLEPPPRTRRGFGERMYSRQRLLLGEEGQRLLSASTVGVIGLGGGGSHVVQQLALLGVGKLVLVDDDAVEEVNRHRLVGAVPADAAHGTLKTIVMERLVQASNPFVQVSVCNNRFPSDEALAALKECDVMVGCVDTLAARREIQDFAWRYLIPYIDIGVSIVPEPTAVGKAKVISGQVYDLIPGEACLWCAQLITPAALDKETGGRGPTYIDQSDQHAQVVSFNGVLASAAVTEVLHILTGFSRRELIPNALQFDGNSGTLTPVLLERKGGCSICGLELGRGDPVW